jgi:hypothetical protein
MHSKEKSFNWRKKQGEAILRNQSKRAPIICSNGIKVKSSQEKRIAEYLILNNIDFEYERKLSIGYKTYYPDFYLINQDTYIEFFGWTHIPSYQKKTEEKIQMYENYNISCIYLYLKGSRYLEDKLAEKIQNL